MGSVKDLIVLLEPTVEKAGIGRFTYSNRYSVFDWGTMPDEITDKGAALCMMAAYFFESLGRQGIRTHYSGFAFPGSFMTHFVNDVNEPSNQMAVKLVRRQSPVMHTGDDARRITQEADRIVATVGSGDEMIAYDYTEFSKPENQRNMMIPLEVIYRNTLPKGSSVFRRLGEGSIKLDDLGLSEMPAKGDRLPKPFFDVSTKYESSGDRYMKWTEAMKLTSITPRNNLLLKDSMHTANDVISEGFAKIGANNDDGKLEFAYDETGKIEVVDALGTLDECRATHQRGGVSIQLSKEVARQHYEKTQPEWVRQIREAKKTHPANWRDHVTERPKSLPPELRDMIGYMYTSVANAVLGRNIFDAPDFDEVAEYFTKRLAA